MSRTLITSWSDYQLALDQILALPGQQLMIYDQDLLGMKLESAARMGALTCILQHSKQSALRIALRDGNPLRTQQPRMLNLLTRFTHKVFAHETPEHLKHLRDSMLLLDNQHALIRFDRDQPRGKLLVDEPEEVAAYFKRFESIWAEGGDCISASTLGL